MCSCTLMKQCAVREKVYVVQCKVAKTLLGLRVKIWYMELF